MKGADLFQIVSALYSEQVVGFYDSDKEEMFVSSNSPQLDFNSKSTFAHELTHALQDQHFDLDLLLPEDSDNDDLDRAKRALVEGRCVPPDLGLHHGAFDIGRAVPAGRRYSLQERAHDLAGGLRSSPTARAWSSYSLCSPKVAGKQ